MTVPQDERIAQALRRAQAANVHQIGQGRTNEGLEFRVTTSASGDGHHLVVIGGWGFETLTCDCMGAAGACMHKAIVWQSLYRRIPERYWHMGGQPFKGIYK